MQSLSGHAVSTSQSRTKGISDPDKYILKLLEPILTLYIFAEITQ